MDNSIADCFQSTARTNKSRFKSVFAFEYRPPYGMSPIRYGNRRHQMQFSSVW